MLAASSRLILCFCTGMLAILAGCSMVAPERASTPPPPVAPQVSEAERWAARVGAVTATDEWRVKGKIAYRVPDDAGSANLDWQQSRNQTELRLSGPMGVGSTEIRNDGALLLVRRDGIERLYPADAAPWLPGGALLPVPVDSIQHWLRGIPDPALDTTVLETEDGLARVIDQEGWRIRFSEYREFQGIAMPARLILEAPDVNLVLKLILREWTL